MKNSFLLSNGLISAALIVLLVLNSAVFGFGLLFQLIAVVIALISISFLNYQNSKLFVHGHINLKDGMEKITQTLNELALESHYLYNSSNSQSSAIQSSASSIEETLAMAEQTAQQSSASSTLALEINKVASNGSQIMNELRDSIESINALNKEIQHIQEMFQMVTEKTRVIDEIVFNTKLLSFNASIEAERAGTHGAGFAVVAQEIGKLANNSGLAAKDIREILKESNSTVGSIVSDTANKVSNGRKVTERVIENFNNIIVKVAEVSQKLEAIKTATKEQEIGIKQISQAVTNMDLAAQENVKVAHNTELLSAKSEDQLNELNTILAEIAAKLNLDATQNLNTANDLITWNASYELGIQSIDEQHIQLVDIINQLYRAIKNNEALSRLDQIFKALIDYTEKHFSFEEIMFSESDYPNVPEHKELHRKFVKKIEDLKSKFKSGNGVMTRDVMDFLKDWLIEHIQKTDFKYAPFVKKQGVK